MTKYLLPLSLILLFSCNVMGQDSARKVMHPYYYRWSYYDKQNGDNGWGENTICLNHKPTKIEVIDRIKYLFDANRRKRVLSLITIDLIIIDDNYPMRCQLDSAIKKAF